MTATSYASNAARGGRAAHPAVVCAPVESTKQSRARYFLLLHCLKGLAAHAGDNAYATSERLNGERREGRQLRNASFSGRRPLKAQGTREPYCNVGRLNLCISNVFVRYLPLREYHNGSAVVIGTVVCGLRSARMVADHSMDRQCFQRLRCSNAEKTWRTYITT